MKALHIVSSILLIVGGLNWMGHVWGYELSRFISNEQVMNGVYILVGLAAIFEIVTHKGNCKACGMGTNSGAM